MTRGFSAAYQLIIIFVILSATSDSISNSKRVSNALQLLAAAVAILYQMSQETICQRVASKTLTKSIYGNIHILKLFLHEFKIPWRIIIHFYKTTGGPSSDSHRAKNIPFILTKFMNQFPFRKPNVMFMHYTLLLEDYPGIMQLLY